MRLGINASRARSGGGVAHLKGIIDAINPHEYNFSQVHVWSYPKLLDSLPEEKWLIKHTPKQLSQTLWRQLWWERFSLPRELKKAECNINLNVDAGSVCRFYPSITMSRDMLCYEPGEAERYGIGRERLRLFILRIIQNASLRSAVGAIFLTRYAADTIQKYTGKLPNIAYIPHGVGKEFRSDTPPNVRIRKSDDKVRCLYISNALPYKHQWHVVDAVSELRKKTGFDLELCLVGGGEGSAEERLEKQISKSDPQGEFVVRHEFLQQHELPTFLNEADIFIFASSCENMPNTLLEAMSSGIPIACSDRGPMPEVLKDGGIYFDPENRASIMEAVLEFIYEPKKGRQLAERAKKHSQIYSWERCAKETFSFAAQNATTKSVRKK